MLAEPGLDVGRTDHLRRAGVRCSGASYESRIVTSGSAASSALATSRPSGAPDDEMVRSVVSERPARRGREGSEQRAGDMHPRRSSG